MLNYEEIRKLNIIQQCALKNYKNASYDLRVDKIITPDGKEQDTYSIKPNCMVVVVSQESVTVPENVIGFAYVKTSLSQKGIMANNIGIIDPQYSGPLSSVLINFGKEEYELSKDDPFLRITFTDFKTPHTKISIGYGPFESKEYLINRKGDAQSYLGNSFANIDYIIKEAQKEIQTHYRSLFKNIGIWVAIAALVLNLFVFGFNLNRSVTEESKANYKQNEIFKSQMNSFYNTKTSIYAMEKQLQKKVDSLSLICDSINLRSVKK
jgi:Deoxycytidine deaminase